MAHLDIADATRPVAPLFVAPLRRRLLEVVASVSRTRQANSEIRYVVRMFGDEKSRLCRDAADAILVVCPPVAVGLARP